MRILGFTGGIDAVHENRYNFRFDQIHDAAAVLIEDGRVVAGIEEERLNRIKHTNKAAGGAIRFCLSQARISLDQLDAIAFYATELYCNRVLRLVHFHNPAVGELLTGQGMVQRILREGVGREIAPDRIRFVGHHWAHAVSAYYLSRFDDALVMTIDGQGEGISGMVFDGRGQRLELLRSMPEDQSIGFFYRDVIRFIGYDMFDEYKAMGLAPYGDPARFRQLFEAFYELGADGHYRLHLDRVQGLYDYVVPRRKGEPFTQTYKDLAAALQEAVEAVALHMVRHFQKATGHRRLCLAGGVAHNCSLNGRILYSRLFDELSVQPASHDAGCALGAALAVHIESGGSKPAPLEHVYWGTDVGSDEEIASELGRWSRFLSIERKADIVSAAAETLASRGVVGWVQGRSEFGPRALGNRSILADPRPAEHKDIINRMVKKREAYRPFAPSILEERVADFFVVPEAQTKFPYMTVVVEVRPEMRELLGAITHVDGTARIQTVSKRANARYWDVIDAFGRLTGVPILLNTSFNNNVEPIVDSVEDAIVCFLTTGLCYLVAGSFLVTKRDVDADAHLDLKVSLPPAVVLHADTRHTSPGCLEHHHEARFSYHNGKSAPLSAELFAALQDANGELTFGELAERAEIPEARVPELVGELLELWALRMVILQP